MGKDKRYVVRYWRDADDVWPVRVHQFLRSGAVIERPTRTTCGLSEEDARRRAKSLARVYHNAEVVRV
jgi:hypothetical protein